MLYYLWTALKFVLTVLSLTIVAYVVIALVYSTDEEKRLKEQNALYERIYPTLPSKIDKIGTDLATLAKKDDIIYKDIFHSEPPKDDPMASLGRWARAPSHGTPAGEHQLHPDRGRYRHQNQSVLHHHGAAQRS